MRFGVMPQQGTTGITAMLRRINGKYLAKKDFELVFADLKKAFD